MPKPIISLARYRSLSAAKRYAAELGRAFPERLFMAHVAPNSFQYGVAVLDKEKGEVIAWAGKRPRGGPQPVTKGA